MLNKKITPMGFTLLELLIVVAVAIILVSFGFPQMNNFFHRNVITTQTNRLYGFLLYARSESIRRGSPIYVATTEQSWSSGWVAWVDENANNQWDLGEEIRQESAFTGVNLSVNRLADEPWFFNAQGLSSADITFDVCSKSLGKTSENGKTISLLISGLAFIDDKVCKKKQIDSSSSGEGNNA